ncbi:hypothetical protein V494_06682 [Pseudogymnoascus sp. VKM F-4513 (FW-928)]|nr:hypothetical protein V494_06682 [Pseudogymnoascus sp. VKM F-4513 (FW-928)]
MISILSLLVVTIIAATPTLSMPAAPDVDVRSAPAGDGYYKVSPNSDGTFSTTFTSPADLDFTPVDNGNTTTGSTPSARSSLQERFGDDVSRVYCQDAVLNADDTLNAQACLRAAADKEKNWEDKNWAFCRWGSVMAYACPHAPGGAPVSGDYINKYQLAIDNKCGWPTTGYNDRGFLVGGGIGTVFDIDLSVGRTSFGTIFCTKGFVGW